MIKRIIFAGVTAIFFVLTLLACDNHKGTSLQEGTTETPTATMLKTPFKDAIEPVLYELPSGALATWRDYAEYKPTLVLYSTHPLLDPIPAERKKAIGKLLKHGTAAEIVSRARLLSSNPIILPPEAVSAAIDNGIFSELVIVLPNLKSPEEVTLDKLRKRMISAGFLSEAESAGLTLNDGVVSGTVRNLPLRVVHPQRLPKIMTPIILHVDLGYFKDMYVNEIKTPAYELLHQLATSVKNADYPTLATTLSFSNQEVDFSLESRFMIRDLADILRQPQFLGGNTPASWGLRTNALYATAMFEESRARELTAQAVKVSPNDAAAHYSLALDLFKQRHAEEGFAALDQAVALDRGYGLEYLELAERGKELGKMDKSIDLLQRAAQAIPDTPFIRLELINQLIQSGRVKEARPLIAALRKLDWSEMFYPEIPRLLVQMEEAAAVDTVMPKKSPVTPPAAAPTNNPAGGMPGFNHMGMGRQGD